MTDNIHQIKLNSRLKAIFELCMGRGTTFCDVGCDHGKLAASLALLQQVKSVIATDISERSLFKARNLCEELSLDAKMSFRLGDGLSVLSANEVDTVIISGMGADTIVEILRGKEENGFNYVLQPSRNPYSLLRYLYENYYLIKKASVNLYSGRYYQTFYAERGNQRDELLRDFDMRMLFFSPRAIEDREPMLLPMLNKSKGILEKKLKKYDSKVLREEYLLVCKAIEYVEALLIYVD